MRSLGAYPVRAAISNRRASARCLRDRVLRNGLANPQSIPASSRTRRLHPGGSATAICQRQGSGRAISVSSASCSSSASRTSGQASLAYLVDGRGIEPSQSRTTAIPAARGASPRRARGAPRAEHRRDRRRDWRSEFRAKTPTAPACRRPGTNAAVSEIAQARRFKPSRSSASVEHVLHRLADERMIGNDDVADDIFLAGQRLRENGRQQIFRAHALNLAAALSSRPENAAAPARVPRPSASARAKSGAASTACSSTSCNGSGMQIMKYVRERESCAVRRAKYSGRCRWRRPAIRN